MSQISENRWQLEREREIREAARKAREAEINQRKFICAVTNSS